MSDLSQQSGVKRTLIKSLSPLGSLYEYTSLITDVGTAARALA